MRLKLTTKEMTRDHCIARKCFIASEVVSFLVLNDFARTRPQAVLIGKALGSFTIYMRILEKPNANLKARYLS